MADSPKNRSSLESTSATFVFNKGHERSDQAPRLGYKWGLFFGWATVITALAGLAFNGYQALDSSNSARIQSTYLSHSIPLFCLIPIGVGILMRKRWVFIAGTLISFNIFLWIFHVIYLKNRWRQLTQVNTSNPKLPQWIVEEAPFTIAFSILIASAWMLFDIRRPDLVDVFYVCLVGVAWGLAIVACAWAFFRIRLWARQIEFTAFELRAIKFFGAVWTGAVVFWSITTDHYGSYISSDELFSLGATIFGWPALVVGIYLGLTRYLFDESQTQQHNKPDE